jgi:YD repeat-containing protein
MKHVVCFIIVLIIIGLGTDVFSQIPNSVRTITYFSTTVYQTSTNYTDGMGKQLQSRLELDDTHARIITTHYDAAGRACTTSVPFSTTTAGYIADPIMNLYLNDPHYSGETAPFNETRYKPDPLGRPDSVGAPSGPFSLYDTHFQRSWYFGTEMGASNDPIDANGFIKEDAMLTNDYLDLYESTGVLPYGRVPTHYLTVTKGANNNSYTQELKDRFGRTVSVCNMNNLRSENAYDVMGNLRAVYPPLNATRGVAYTGSGSELKDTFDYDIRGLMIRKKTADAGEVKYIYDDAGRLCCIQNAKQLTLHQSDYDEYFVYIYDEQGRNVGIGINKDKTILFSAAQDHVPWTLTNTDVLIRRIYDDPGQLADVIGISATAINTRFTPITIKNTRGRLLAEIAYTTIYPGTPGSDQFFKNVTIDIYSYDAEGNIVAKYRRIPGMANFCLFTYSYDLQGNVISYKYAKNDQNVAPAMDDLTYDRDNLGRIQHINQSGSNFLNYEYDAYGRLTKKKFAGTETTPIDMVTIGYNIRNWITSIASSNGIFSQAVYYNDIISGNAAQYNGNISAASYSYDNTTLNGSVNYAYDNVNRLTGVTNVANRALYPNEKFTYEANGRISTKKKGGELPGAYTYYENSNRLEKIVNRIPKDKSNNFLYDQNGNMVLDQSKLMLVDYDWRDMPVNFKFFDKIPQTALSGDIATLESRIINPTLTGHGTMVSKVKMTYDAGGNRVLKQEYKYQ